MKINFNVTSKMPRRYKRRNKRKMPYRKYYNKAKSVASKAYTAYNIATKIARLVNVEHKMVEEVVSISEDWDGTLTTLNAVAGLGTGDDDNRVGDSIKNQFLSVRGHVAFNQDASALAVQTFTVIIFQDYQNTCASPSYILETARVGTSIAPYAHKDKDHGYRSKILWKRTFTLSVQRDVARFHAKIKLHGHTQFEAGTATINTNAYKMLTISNNPASSPTYNVPIQCISRFYYTDN